MQSKKSGHQCTPPQSTGPAVEQQEQNNDIEHMQEKTGEVVSGRIKPEELAIQLIENPG